jgi:hypothetical protein
VGDDADAAPEMCHCSSQPAGPVAIFTRRVDERRKRVMPLVTFAWEPMRNQRRGPSSRSMRSRPPRPRSTMPIGLQKLVGLGCTVVHVPPVPPWACQAPAPQAQPCQYATGQNAIGQPHSAANTMFTRRRMRWSPTYIPMTSSWGCDMFHVGPGAGGCY